jgi:hypothetical protein
MRGEVEFVEEGIHEAAPFIVVRLGEGENDGHVELHVDSLKNSNRWRRRGDGGAGERDAVGGGGGRGGLREIGLKEWVGIHGAGSWWAAERVGGPRG